MRRRLLLVTCLGAGLISIACPSRRPGPGPDKAAALRARIDFLGVALAEHGLTARVLGELSRALPENAWLTEVGYDGAGIRAKGYAPSNTVVADYVSRLGGSPSLAEVNLQTSVERRIRNREFQEFTVQAAVRGARGGKPSAPEAEADAGDLDALTGRLAELEKNLTAGKDSAGILRQFQLAADGSGLKITKFAPGGELPGEFYREWPISIEVTGSRQSLGRFLEQVGELPGLWLVEKFSFKAVSGQEPASSVRVSLAVATYLVK